MNKKNNYFFLHGFLGNEKSFSKIINQLKQKPCTGGIFAPNLLSKDAEPLLTPKYGFIDWANNFNDFVEKNSSGNNIMIAYSMGGRLGIHAFQENPLLWQKCYFVSSNPGFIKNQEKMGRMAWEDGWCYQIDNKPWNDFLSLWNNQDVFKKSKSVNKAQENLFDRQLLKLAMKNWSLTKHTIDLNLISNKKLHWLVGEDDSKYKNIFKNLKISYGCSQISLIKGNSHRVELDLSHLN